MVDTIAAIQGQPSIARFRFRNSNRWVDGGENRSTIQGFYGANQEDRSRTQPFVFTNGEPPVLLGNNEGANPVEFLLHALAGCVTTTFVLHATARGIKIDSISTEMDGDIDLQGLLGLDDSVPAGYEQIRIKMDPRPIAPTRISLRCWPTPRTTRRSATPSAGRFRSRSKGAQRPPASASRMRKNRPRRRVGRRGLRASISLIL